MIRRCVAVIAITAAAVATATPASALTTTREPVAPQVNLSLVGFCPFPVIANDLVNREVQTTFTDTSGDIVKIMIHGHVVSQYTNVETGKTVTVNNSGPVTITFNDDGTLTIVQRGQSVSGDQGVLTGDPFLIHESGRLVTVAQPNQSGFVDFISQERHGNTMDLCAALADP